MPTGFPFFALGRNEDSAWGGTNLYAASSSFLDVSDLPEDEITTKMVTVRVNSRDREMPVRETKYGPIITDLEMFAEKSVPDVALRWVGKPVDASSVWIFLYTGSSLCWTID